ncbi:putative ribonuclease H-like domain-containing protein [Tanacetum coccineum]|uniref:Ribonuclease H-like domain-containing protein n=1 Tax=Tanacetum coccineum TaxID=301880 RepID=A0ABQ5H557_9ASTR
MLLGLIRQILLRPQHVGFGDLPNLIGKPQQDYTGFIDSGCSRRMTGNIAYLSDFKEFDGGYVTFGGGAHGGRISGKGTLKTDNLDFEDVQRIENKAKNGMRFGWQGSRANNWCTSSIPLKDIIIFGLPPCVAITPALSPEEPVDSLIMKDEHLDTIPEKTESDEFIKFRIENLVQNPSEFEDVSDVIFPSGDKDKVFDPGILAINGVHSKRFSILLMDDFSSILFVRDFLILTDPSKIKTFLSFPFRNEDKVQRIENKAKTVYEVISMWNDPEAHVASKDCWLQLLTCLVAKATSDESMLWHRRLGHINFKNINKLVKDNLVRGLPTKHFENDQTCVACLKGKQHRASCKSKVLNPITKPLFMLHMDLFGLTFMSSLMHKKYCLVVTDDYSRFTWVFFLTTKDETNEILKNFIKEIENLVDKKVKIIRSDNRIGFKNKVMDDFCREKGIKREYSVARTPQQNGVAERRNKTLIEAVRTMLVDSKLPTTFWAEAVSTACYVQNRVLVVKPHNKTSYELFRGFKPALRFMRPFGCHVIIFNTLDNLGKFDGKSDKENKPMIEGNGPKWLFDIDSLTQSMNYVPVAAGTISNKYAGTQGEINAGTSTQKEEISQDCSCECHLERCFILLNSPTKDVGIGEQNLLMKIKSRLKMVPHQEMMKKNKIEPTSIAKALSDSSWVEAMQEELLQFLSSNRFFWYIQMDGRVLSLYGTIEGRGYFTQQQDLKILSPTIQKKLQVVKALMVESGSKSMKPEGSEDFHQIVDFLNASQIQYALIKNPKIYVSIIQQFWGTTTARTTDDGEVEITTSIDGQVKTITETYLRRHLKLSYISKGQLFSSVEFFIHTILHLADEATFTSVNVDAGGAATTDIGLDAGQGSGTIHKTPTRPHDSPLPRVHTLGSDEGSLQQNELMDLVTKLTDRVEVLENDMQQTKKVYSSALTKLILRVKKLEKKVKTNKARRRARIVISRMKMLKRIIPNRGGRSLKLIKILQSHWYNLSKTWNMILMLVLDM